MAKDKCDRNCATCGAENRSFCAVQMAMANQELLLALSAKIDVLSAKPDAEFIPPAIAEPTDSGAATINK